MSQKNTNTKPISKTPTDVKFGLVTQENPLRYIVRSAHSENEVYVVDLDPVQYDERLGTNVVTYERCTCMHFQCRIEPLIKSKIIKPDTDQARCKHIMKLRGFLADRLRDYLSHSANSRK